MKALELTGKRFGRWIVVKRVENNKWNKSQWLCKCDCGNVKIIIARVLVLNKSQSCGCLQKEITYKRSLKHGYAKRGNQTKTYITWAHMLQRCHNPKAKHYKYYGNRGIKVCDKWRSFKNFLKDMGERPKGLTIERVDNDGNYEPDNCVWATRREQRRNNRYAKLNPLKVQVIKKLLKESKLKQWEIAEIFHVARVTINDINTDRHWSDINY